MNKLFHKFAGRAAHIVGTPWAFLLAVAVVVVWASLGPRFGWSDTHQLIINTGTTIVTFLMVFLIQNTQNRDAETMQIKLDELIRATQGARNTLINLDKLSDKQLEDLEEEFKRICEEGDGDTSASREVKAIDEELDKREAEKRKQ